VKKLDCPIHDEPLFEHDYDKRIGYCKRCRRWYLVDDEEMEEEEN